MHLQSFSFLHLSTLALALTTWESIHQTLHTYPLAIDSKDFGLLSKVFAPTATANYTGPLSNLTGLPAIQSGLAASVANVNSQHLLGTTVIDIHSKNNGNNDNNNNNKTRSTANSTTYFYATLFGNAYSVGSVVYLQGYYADVLERVKGSEIENDEGESGWRISSRELVFIGPGYVGNLSLVGM